MTTKGKYLPGNFDIINNETTNGQYNNLNLNGQYQSLKLDTVSSKDATNEKRKEQSGNSDSVRTSSSWRKATTSDFLTSGRGYEENIKQKNKKNCKTNSSTLSLHIAAYENSIEANNKSNVDKKEQFSSSPINPFEFPRQQDGDYRARPEVSNYRASQRLLDPTGASSSSGVAVSRARGRPKKKPPAEERLYSDDEDFDDGDDASSQNSVSTTDSQGCRRSGRRSVAPSSFRDYVSSDRRVRFNFGGAGENVEEQERVADVEEQERVADVEEQERVADVEEQERVADVEEQERVADFEEQEIVEDVTEEERAEEIRRLVHQQNMELNYEEEEYVVADSSETEEEQPPVKKRKRTAATIRQDIINPPDLYFIGKCDDCVFFASYLDVTSNTAIIKKSTVTLPVFGPSRVIYDNIADAATAEKEAKNYAHGMGYKYAKAGAKFKIFFSAAPARAALDPNEDRIVELEDSARQHRVEMASMKIRLTSVEKRLEDILSGRVAIPNVNPVQAADTEDRASVEEVPMPFAPPPPVPLPVAPPQPMQPLVVSSSEIEDAPLWNRISEDAARQLYHNNPQPKVFIRSIFVNMFTDFQSFHLSLPFELKNEFVKICSLLIDPSPPEVALKKLITDEINYQRERVRTKITQSKSPAVAMLSTSVPLTYSTPVPLVQQGNQWFPQGNIRFQRVQGSNVSAWPVLEKDGTLGATMFAERKNPENARSTWNYFIISPDGLLTSSFQILPNYTPIGPRFSNLVLQSLLVLLNSEPPKGHRLLVLATSSSVEFLQDVDLLSRFPKVVRVRQLRHLDEMISVCEEANLFGDDELRWIKQELGKIENLPPLGIKSLLHILAFVRASDERAKTFVSQIEELSLGL
uniref:Vesicle-fusing ATPase n=1 Tax=Panagrolaimus davidi TaxID=227884 RepID=A0A914R8D7_9BILA